MAVNERINRYWIERQPTQHDEWEYVSECGDEMTLPEMALQAIDILQATQSAYTRVRCIQAVSARGPETIEVITSKHTDQQRARWQRKYEREQKAKVS